MEPIKTSFTYQRLVILNSMQKYCILKQFMEIDEIEMEICQGVIEYRSLWKDVGTTAEFSVSTIKEKVWDTKLQINESKKKGGHGGKVKIKVK